MRYFGCRPVIRRLIGFISFALLLALKDSAMAQSPHGNLGSDTISPITAEFCEDMKVHHVLSAKPQIGCDRLRSVKFRYLGLDDNIHDDGEVVVMDAVASHVLRIFVSLRKMGFPIAKARPLNAYDGDDNASMRDNNSSAFNDRNLTGGGSISLHAYGLAIDLNPVQNPYLARLDGMLKIEPPAGADYINRLNPRPWKRGRPGMAEAAVGIFADNGFLIWGGYWDGPVDYQHFQVGRKLAERLAGSSPSEAAEVFNRVVDRFKMCQRKYPLSTKPNPACVMRADPTEN
jgi:hypothetical protein